jgi:hypothetical protein
VIFTDLGRLHLGDDRIRSSFSLQTRSGGASKQRTISNYTEIRPICLYEIARFFRVRPRLRRGIRRGGPCPAKVLGTNPAIIPLFFFAFVAAAISGGRLCLCVCFWFGEMRPPIFYRLS